MGTKEPDQKARRGEANTTRRVGDRQKTNGKKKKQKNKNKKPKTKKENIYETNNGNNNCITNKLHILLHFSSFHTITTNPANSKGASPYTK